MFCCAVSFIMTCNMEQVSVRRENMLLTGNVDFILDKLSDNIPVPLQRSMDSLKNELVSAAANWCKKMYHLLHEGSKSKYYIAKRIKGRCTKRKNSNFHSYRILLRMSCIFWKTTLLNCCLISVIGRKNKANKYAFWEPVLKQPLDAAEARRGFKDNLCLHSTAIINNYEKLFLAQISRLLQEVTQVYFPYVFFLFFKGTLWTTAGKEIWWDRH